MTQTLRFIVFFAVLAVALGGLNLLVHRRVASAFEFGPRARRGLAAFLGVSAAAVFLGRFVPTAGIARFVSGAGSVAQVGVIVASLLFLAERLLVRAGLYALRRRSREVALATSAGDTSTVTLEREQEPVTSAPPSMLSRRALLSRASATAVLSVGGGSAAYGGLRGRHDYAVEEVPIRLAKLPRTLDGFTIAQLSDIHLGLFVGEWEMARALELVKRCKPDLIAITGDMIDHQIAYADDLGRLVRALSGVAQVVAVPGNHDHYAGVDRALDAVRAGGGRALLNAATRVGEGRILVAGVDDLWARRFRLGGGPDLDAALSTADEESPRILLAHQPQYFDESASRVDLQLSGHTHGGQFNLGVRPADYVLPHGWVAGRYEVGASQLYVNRGFGTAGPPARLGAAPEVTRLVLTV